MEYEDGYETSYCWNSWNNSEKPGKEAGELVIQELMET